MLLRKASIDSCNVITAQSPTWTLRLHSAPLYTNLKSKFTSTERSILTRTQASRYASDTSGSRLGERVEGLTIPLMRRATDDRDSPADFSALFTQRGHSSSKFVSVVEIRHIAMRYLSSHEDGLRFIAAFPAFVRALRNDNRSLSDSEYILNTYNAIMFRLHQRGIDFNDEMISHGILFASMARSVPGVRYYLKMLAPGYQLDDVKSVEVLRNFQDYIEQENFSPTEGGKCKQELLDVLIGFSSGGSREAEQKPQSCLYSIMNKSRPDFWDAFISIVHQLSGTDAVYDEWLHFRASSLFDRRSGKIGVEQEPRHLLAVMIIERFVRKLAVGDPERAYQIIKDVELPPEMLQYQTWDLLLEHPEFIHKWDSGMKDIVLQNYERSIENIERALGIRWSGGEDGYHVASLPPREDLS